MPKCRECGVGLVQGKNWYDGYARGHAYICKNCQGVRNRRYRTKHKDRVAAYNRAYRRAHREEFAAYYRAYQ